MNSTSTPKQADPNEIMIARLEEANARAYEAHKLAQADKQLSNPVHDAADHPSDDSQTPGNNFRPAATADWLPLAGPATRRFLGLLLVAFIGVAALIWPLSYSDAAKQLIAGWASQSTPSSSQALGKPGFAAPTNAPAVQVDRAKATAPRTVPQGQTAPDDAAPTTAAQAAELARLLQTIAGDLATMGQGIEQLKASQEQMARNNAKIAEQLKANQEQTARDNAKITEQLDASQEQMARFIAKASKRNPRPKTSAPPPAR